MQPKSYRLLNVYTASVSVAAGALMASYDEAWWAFLLGSLGAFNLGAAVVGRHALRWAFRTIWLDLRNHGEDRQ